MYFLRSRILNQPILICSHQMIYRNHNHTKILIHLFSSRFPTMIHQSSEKTKILKSNEICFSSAFQLSVRNLSNQNESWPFHSFAQNVKHVSHIVCKLKSFDSWYSNCKKKILDTVKYDIFLLEYVAHIFHPIT